MTSAAAGHSYLPHDPPVYKSGEGDVGTPSHYEIPNEKGYFPAAADGAGMVVHCDPATLYQIHPRYYPRASVEDFTDGPLASGALILRDPDGGTADEVALVGECGDVLFYVTANDVTTKTSESEFVLLLPEDCIVVDLKGVDPATLLKVEGVLAARTHFHDETAAGDKGATVYPSDLPDDATSRALFRTSSTVARFIVGASKRGANMIDDYGDKKRGSITETREVKVGKGGTILAKSAQRASVFTLAAVTKVSVTISDALGSKLGKAAAIKKDDTASKRKARSLLLASSLAYAEVADGASEGYEIVMKSAQGQVTSFVAEKYGAEAAELARHTAGATVNFGRAALTARRVVNVKKIAKSAGKHMVKEAIKSSIK